MKTFTFYLDPGHGWLKVGHADYAALGFKPADFSRCSYVAVADGALYLEEDCDAAKFITAYRAKHGAISIRESHTNSSSFIRRLRHNVVGA